MDHSNCKLIIVNRHISFSAQSVDLVGSWDNFSKRYPMEQDLRRGHGQWRGVHSFKDITCDGDGTVNAKRNGGLKMGHEYWYYVSAMPSYCLHGCADENQYELNDGTEIHNEVLPSTTTCPYLPGQPVNILNVPTEINPLRERSASESAMSGHIPTMNPADKFLSPRAAPAIPPRPQLPRLNTAPPMSLKTRTSRPRTARSVSPASRAPWSARSLFGLRSALPTNSDSRGRDQESPVTQEPRSAAINRPQWIMSPAEIRALKALPGTLATSESMISRNASPHSVRKPLSRDPSPLRHPILTENSVNALNITIPDEITEEDLEDDDANFASPMDPEKTVVTSLAPPPSQLSLRRSPSTLHLGTKPLPLLPDESATPPIADSPSIVPAPLKVTLPSSSNARSHFSIDTVSSELISPTDSHFSSVPSIYSSNDEDGDAVLDESFASHVGVDSAELNGGFQYSLPDVDSGSEATLGKPEEPKSLGLQDKFTVRSTFDNEGKDQDPMSALDDLLAEMGYLSGMIK